MSATVYKRPSDLVECIVHGNRLLAFCCSLFPNQRVSECEVDVAFTRRRSLCRLIRCGGLLSSVDWVTPDL